MNNPPRIADADDEPTDTDQLFNVGAEDEENARKLLRRQTVYLTVRADEGPAYGKILVKTEVSVEQLANVYSEFQLIKKH